MGCEYCGEEKDSEGTRTVGNYCIACHRLVIGESREAIRIIKARAKTSHNKRKADICPECKGTKYITHLNHTGPETIGCPYCDQTGVKNGKRKRSAIA